jgi:hypothetical protein
MFDGGRKMEYRTQTEIEMEKYRQKEIIREIVVAGLQTLGAFTLVAVAVFVFLIIGE